MVDIRKSTIDELATLLDSGSVSAVELLNSYIQAIQSEDKNYNAIAFLNPDAEKIALELDNERRNGFVRGPLHGIPILLKDNIDTADKMITSAGSLALNGNIAQKDAHLVERLRGAGAIILGKTNLSEWANFRSTRSSSGWSSRGGQVRNAYATDRTPGGSSSGSAVAVARGFCAGAIGTETDGSVVGPSSMNSIVGIKPTVGMVSRNGIIPISHSQDTAGPMAKTVSDAAIMLSIISGYDPSDNFPMEFERIKEKKIFRKKDKGALKGKRVGIVRNYAGFHDGVDNIFEQALAGLKEAGAELIDEISLVSQSEIRKYELLVMRTEFKVGLNAYLARQAAPAKIGSLNELIEFNDKNRKLVMPFFGQEQLIASEETDGLDNFHYKQALETSRYLTRDVGIDKAMFDHDLCALVMPTGSAPWSIDLINGDNRLGGSSCQAAVSGYPSITVPMGYLSGLPVGMSFVGKPWHDFFLTGLASAFEQNFGVRVDPGKASPFLVGSK